LPGAVVQVADRARIPSCCGCDRTAAVALTQSLAWEFPYAEGVALKGQKKKKGKEK